MYGSRPEGCDGDLRGWPVSGQSEWCLSDVEVCRYFMVWDAHVHGHWLDCLWLDCLLLILKKKKVVRTGSQIPPKHPNRFSFPAEPNRGVGHGSAKRASELNRPEPWHHYPGPPEGA